jgi:hypothetical protein
MLRILIASITSFIMMIKEAEVHEGGSTETNQNMRPKTSLIILDGLLKGSNGNDDYGLAVVIICVTSLRNPPYALPPARRIFVITFFHSSSLGRFMAIRSLIPLSRALSDPMTSAVGMSSVSHVEPFHSTLRARR